MTDNERNLQQQLEEKDKQLQRIIQPVCKLVEAVRDKAAVTVTLNQEEVCADRYDQLKQQYLNAERSANEAILEQIDLVREVAG